jgi:thioredoxin:protein disulfide reductase
VLAVISSGGRAHAQTAMPPLEATSRVELQSAGDRPATDFALDVKLPDGWHVNAHEPDRPYVIPTELTLEPPAGVTVRAVRYPIPVVRTLRFSPGAPLKLYEGRFTIGVSLAGELRTPVNGRLRYQACNDESCLPPRTLPVTLTLAAVASGTGGAISDGAAASHFETWLRERGLAVTLLLAALFGLGLNLTPCVYPLITVTIAYFGGQSRGASSRIPLLAGAYVLGIAITFSALGVVAALSGGLFGAALQRPLVLGGIAVLLVLLAASNFGVYQLRMPAILSSRAGKAASGVVGAFGMGLTMGIVAAPCVGPIVIALLLFVAARQDALLGFALFFALAVGMGLPYLGLALAAGSIRRLPRSGEWLTWIEHLFGFLLLGMALYFAGPLLGDRVVAVATPALIAVAGVTLGFVDPAGRHLANFAVVRRAFGVVAVAAAVWMATTRSAESAIAWRPFSPDALGAAASAGRPVLVDFTARWCLPCRENDTISFMNPHVAAEAERFTMLRADVTDMTTSSEEAMARFQVLGVPTIILLDRRGEEMTRTVGFVEPERLLAMMRDLR